MPVTSRHPDYDKNIATWKRNALALEGQAAVKHPSVREIYLPLTSGMENQRSRYNNMEPYENYILRARFPDVCQRAAPAALGVLFKEVPQGVTGDIVTSDGLSDFELSRQLCRNLFAKGREALVVDAPRSGGTPTISQYSAESFTNWNEDSYGRLDLAVFLEPTRVPRANDKFLFETVDYYRVFEYTPQGVWVVLLDKLGNVVFDDEGPIEAKVVIPRAFQGRYKLPVIVAGSIDSNPTPDPAPLTKIADCAFNYYLISANYYHILYFSSVSTGWVRGVSEDIYNDLLKNGYGGETLWNLGDSEARVGFLESEGKGAESNKKAMEAELQKAEQLSIELARRTGGVESADTVAMRREAQLSELETLARSASYSMTEALNMRKAMAGSSSFLDFKLNIEPSAEKAEASIISSINAGVIGGNLPPIALYNYFVKSKFFEGTFEEWQAQTNTSNAN